MDCLSAQWQRFALERNLRNDVQDSARATRQELTTTLATFQQTLLAQSSDVARTQNEQIDSFRTQLATMQQRIGDDTRAAREAQDAALHRFGQAQAEQLRALAEANDKRMGEVRQAVEAKLTLIQADNAHKLEQMRATVDEKLSATLEQRLGESFKQVAERLEQVHKGLGEMQTLARDVGSLNRVLTNVKTRGSFGEVQLEALLADVSSRPSSTAATWPRCRAATSASSSRSACRGTTTRAAARRCGCRSTPSSHAKTTSGCSMHRSVPTRTPWMISARAIEQPLEVRRPDQIRDKYIAAPHTTDFGILFVPTEGLYAEALRRPGLVDVLQREFRR